MQMQTKIMHFPQRRRNPERATAEIRTLRREIAALREQVRNLTPPAPWGLGGRP